ncbi:MAG TPA: RNA methyltransferase [Vicinamibacterales bacterium]|jgi:TrmH family RNA methyltransferase|nr:RNA methyltransferase [Vicinamibacterales bacterium]
MRRIASRQNAIVARYRDAARGRADDVMLLDGAHLVSDAVEAGVRLLEAAVAADRQDDVEVRSLVARLAAAGVEVVSVTAPVMAALSPVRSSSVFVALAVRPRQDEAALFRGARPLVVVAVDVQDPGNVGAILRVAEAGGAAGLVVAGASADPYGWKALRGSMGSALRLPLLVRKGAWDPAELRRHKLRVVAAAPRDGRSLFDADLRGPVAILVGGEGAGLPGGVLADADERVTIPMEPGVESLNAAVAAALLVYEARRQRSTDGGSPA